VLPLRIGIVHKADTNLVEIPTSTRHLNASREGRCGSLSEANFSSDSRLQRQQVQMYDGSGTVDRITNKQPVDAAVADSRRQHFSV